MSTRSVKSKSHGLLSVIKQRNARAAVSGAPPEFTSEQTAAAVTNTALFGGPRPIYSVKKDKILELEIGALLCGSNSDPVSCACYLQASTDAVLVRVNTAERIPRVFVTEAMFVQWASEYFENK